MSCGVSRRWAQIWHCCGSGVGRGATALITPLAWELPYATEVALEKTKKKKKKRKENEKWPVQLAFYFCWMVLG